MESRWLDGKRDEVANSRLKAREGIWDWRKLHYC